MSKENQEQLNEKLKKMRYHFECAAIYSFTFECDANTELQDSCTVSISDATTMGGDGGEYKILEMFIEDIVDKGWVATSQGTYCPEHAYLVEDKIDSDSDQCCHFPD